MATRLPIIVRYERHIERTESCWVWHGSANQAGYGQMRSGRGPAPTISVHRWAYEHFVGPIPAGLMVLHHCDNPRCSNPAHLYCGTAKDNARDMLARGRRAKTHAFGARTRKLTDDQVRAIREDTRSLSVVAASFDISETHAHNIRTRQRKQHVPDTPPQQVVSMTEQQVKRRWRVMPSDEGWVLLDTYTGTNDGPWPNRSDAMRAKFRKWQEHWVTP